MQKKTLLLVFVHGFKGNDQTFQNFPHDLRALLQHTLPRIEVLSAVYPAYETRGDLSECVGRFTEWLQNKVLDLEVANDSRSPTLRPSVHVVLCGHSMGGIVAAEALLKVVRDHPVPNILADETGQGSNTTESSSANEKSSKPRSSQPPQLFFPNIRAVVAFDTPFLGISPGVLAYGAEEQINQASSAYKAFDTASSLFGWGNSSKSTTPIANASSRALPAAETNSTAAAGGSWSKWGRYAAVGGAAAAIAGAAGAAYLNRNQISQGFAWAGSHLEFVGCLARGAELQKRVERVVELTNTHGVGFADYYTALGEKVSSRTKYAGSMLGDERTFCVIPRGARGLSGRQNSPTGSKRDAPGSSSGSTSKKHKASGSNTPKGEAEREEDRLRAEGEKMHEFADDPARSKGLWIRCVNDIASDEVTAHTAMFTPKENRDYHTMLPRARDQIVEWVDQEWYEAAGAATGGGTEADTKENEYDPGQDEDRA